MSNKDELDAFIGLNESYAEMERQIFAKAPTCHFKVMRFEAGDDDHYWECDFCGHTKPDASL